MKLENKLARRNKMPRHTPHSLDFLPIFDSERLAFFHYTCNSPSYEVLADYEVEPMGKRFGCADSREILVIPLQLYLNKGFAFSADQDVQKLNLEILLKRLSLEKK